MNPKLVAVKTNTVSIECLPTTLRRYTTSRISSPRSNTRASGYIRDREKFPEPRQEPRVLLGKRGSVDIRI